MQLCGQVMHGVAPHQLGIRDEFQIIDFAVCAIAVPEDDLVARWDGPVMLLPDLPVQQRPDGRTPSLGIALRPFADLDAPVSLVIREDRTHGPIQQFCRAV